MTETALQTGRVDAAVDARVAIVEDHDLLAQSLGYALSNLGIHVTTVADLHAEAVLETLEALRARPRPPRLRPRRRRDRTAPRATRSPTSACAS